MTNSTAIDLKIQNVKGELLVDSRLIAECLGIRHKNFLNNIDVYLTSIEQLGHLAFETRTVTNSVGARNTVKFAMLNEDQATFLMTLSNNTEAVVKAKLSLVKQFSAAKKLLQPDPTALERLTAQIALEFEKDVYRPWRKVNPEADTKFRSLVALPEIPLALEPSQTASVPNTDSLLKFIDTLSLTANRAGLAGNKSTKEAEFLDKQLDKIRIYVTALEKKQTDTYALGAKWCSIAHEYKEVAEQFDKTLTRLLDGCAEKIREDSLLWEKIDIVLNGVEMLKAEIKDLKQTKTSKRR